MDLKTYVADTTRRVELARLLDTAPEYLYQIGTGRRRAGPKLAMRIEAATGISRSLIRPDIYPPEPKRRQIAQSLDGINKRMARLEKLRERT